MSTAGSVSTPQTQSTSSSPRDDWRPVLDPSERRRIQNRLAQRKYRDKVRVQREEETRQEYDRSRAAAAYTQPDPTQMSHGQESGLPWGSFSLPFIVQRGQNRQQQAQGQRHNQQQLPHLPPPPQHIFRPGPSTPRYTQRFMPPQQQGFQHGYDRTSAMWSGGSSSVGLHLVNDYARGFPPWRNWNPQAPSESTHQTSSVTTDSSMVSDWS